MAWDFQQSYIKCLLCTQCYAKYHEFACSWGEGEWCKFIYRNTEALLSTTASKWLLENEMLD